MTLEPIAPAKARRRKAQKRGRLAEAWAGVWLRLRGYRILERNFKTPMGEIDIVARRGHTIIFIEVKSRTTFADAVQAVTPRQRRRIERAAEAFLIRDPALQVYDIRFDVLAALGPLSLSLIEDAWRPGD